MLFIGIFLLPGITRLIHGNPVPESAKKALYSLALRVSFDEMPFNIARPSG